MTADAATASLRERHAEVTRQLILRALAELLRDERADELSVPDVARKAGVSLRTVYRHFPTREELLRAAADWIEERIFGEVSFEETVEDLPKLFRHACACWEQQPLLARAMAVSQAGRSDCSHRRLQRLAAIDRTLAEVTNELPEEEKRRAVAVFGYLENVFAWVSMHHAPALDGGEIEEAVEWAMRTLMGDLRRRNTAAGRARRAGARPARAG
jgi:AcrR family transcriptional regulator